MKTLANFRYFKNTVLKQRNTEKCNIRKFQIQTTLQQHKEIKNCDGELLEERV